MDNSIDKFLEFNGKVIYFLAKDGQYWIAIKPICDALKVQYVRQFKNIKQDEILSQLLSDQTMVGADNRLRKMVCLPERYVYGWIFSIRSDSPELLKYKRECYNLLFEHFHGKITSRETVIGQKTKAAIEYDKLIAAIRVACTNQLFNFIEAPRDT
jgi:hypothetical protein